MSINYELLRNLHAPIGHLPKREQRRVCELRAAYMLMAAATAGVLMNDPDSVARVVAPLVRGAAVEHLHVLLLDTHNKLVTEPVLTAVGTVDGCDVDPRSVLRAALAHPTVTKVILTHNHPSGNLEVSAADISVTRRIAKACEAVGLTLCDHVVVCDVSQFRSIKHTRPDAFAVT